MTYGLIFLAAVPLFGVLLTVLRIAKGVQTIYELSPSTHQGKHGTVSMGGIGIILIAVGATLALFPIDRSVLFCVACLVVFAAIGLLDDVMSMRRKKNMGLSARQKFLTQTAISGVAVWAFHRGIHPLTLWEIPWYIVAMNGFSNATNLTDGLDGLMSGLAVVTLIGFGVIASETGHHTLVPLIATLITVLYAFLVFNLNPAKMFMGDTGSLALGAGFVAIAMVLDAPWILLGFGAVYIVETASVMIQVASYKLTGKRVFKMAPLHHHFELLGWSEQQVVWAFWIVGALMSGVTVWLLI